MTEKPINIPAKFHEAIKEIVAVCRKHGVGSISATLEPSFADENADDRFDFEWCPKWQSHGGFCENSLTITSTLRYRDKT